MAPNSRQPSCFSLRNTESQACATTPGSSPNHFHYLLRAPPLFIWEESFKTAWGWAPALGQVTLSWLQAHMKETERPQSQGLTWPLSCLLTQTCSGVYLKQTLEMLCLIHNKGIKHGDRQSGTTEFSMFFKLKVG